MPELLDPPTATPLDADTTTPPSRTTEAIMAEVRTLGERIRDPNTPPEEKKAMRLRILLELMPEHARHDTAEDRAKDFEVMRGIDSHRPQGHKLFEHALGQEAS